MNLHLTGFNVYDVYNYMVGSDRRKRYCNIHSVGLSTNANCHQFIHCQSGHWRYFDGRALHSIHFCVRFVTTILAVRVYYVCDCLLFSSCLSIHKRIYIGRHKH